MADPLLAFVGKQAKQKAQYIVKHATDDTVRMIAQELEAHVDAIQQAIENSGNRGRRSAT